MARKANPQAVTAKMYRHFAILTVAATLVVGVFADGESRKAVAGEIKAARRPAHAGPTELARKDARAQNRTGGSFGSDSGAFGAPMDQAGAAAQDGLLPAGFAPARAPMVPAGFTTYGVSAEVWATLTPEQKKALMDQVQAERAAAQTPDRAQQIDSLLEASRARSGEATTVE